MFSILYTSKYPYCKLYLKGDSNWKREQTNDYSFPFILHTNLFNFKLTAEKNENFFSSLSLRDSENFFMKFYC